MPDTVAPTPPPRSASPVIINTLLGDAASKVEAAMRSIRRITASADVPVRAFDAAVADLHMARLSIGAIQCEVVKGFAPARVPDPVRRAWDVVCRLREEEPDRRHTRKMDNALADFDATLRNYCNP